MIPGVGTIINFVSKTLQMPAKALKVAAKGLKGLPGKLQAAADAKNAEGLMGVLDTNGQISTLKSMIGDPSKPNRQARSLWQTISRGFIQPVTKNLPNMRFVNTENLVRKPFMAIAKEAAKDKLEQKKQKREQRNRDSFEKREHNELKEKWRQERKQRNSSLQFEENLSYDLAPQHDSEKRQLQDYYNVLLDQNATDHDKVMAELHYEQEKLDTKYEQLQLLQNSLSTLQQNFGKLAILNDNSFDTLQEQIATSAEVSDNKQTFYNENLSSDIEYLQSSNDSNAEVIVEAISEGQELQAETLNQLSTMEEQNQFRDTQIGEALETVEQQQKERHIQQMYVLDQLGTKLVEAEQQRQAQSTEQAYIYNKFAKKQQETKLSIPGMITGAILGILNGFFKALANPQQFVDMLASTIGSFVAEVLTAFQFIFGNGLYALGHVYSFIDKPLRNIVERYLGEESAKTILPNKSQLQTALKYVNWLPEKVGMGMPNMLILPPPSIDEIPEYKDTETQKKTQQAYYNVTEHTGETFKEGAKEAFKDLRATMTSKNISTTEKLLYLADLPFFAAKSFYKAASKERVYDPKTGKYVFQNTAQGTLALPQGNPSVPVDNLKEKAAQEKVVVTKAAVVDDNKMQSASNIADKGDGNQAPIINIDNSHNVTVINPPKDQQEPGA